MFKTAVVLALAVFPALRPSPSPSADVDHAEARAVEIVAEYDRCMVSCDGEAPAGEDRHGCQLMCGVVATSYGGELPRAHAEQVQLSISYRDVCHEVCERSTGELGECKRECGRTATAQCGEW